MQEWGNKTAARRKTETWVWSTFWTGHSGSECDLSWVRLDPPMPDITFSLQTTYWNNESPSVRTQTSRLDIHSHVLVDLILKSRTRLLSFFFLFWTVWKVTANRLSSLEENLQNQQRLEKSKRAVAPANLRHKSPWRIRAGLCAVCQILSPEKISLLREAVKVHSLFYSESHSNHSSHI